LLGLLEREGVAPDHKHLVWVGRAIQKK
jgi:hypothetical protein